jgi:hypothetical protein
VSPGARAAAAAAQRARASAAARPGPASEAALFREMERAERSFSSRTSGAGKGAKSGVAGGEPGV